MKKTLLLGALAVSLIQWGSGRSANTAPHSGYDPRQIIVRLHPGVSAHEFAQRHRLRGFAEARPLVESMNLHVLRLAAGVSVPEALKEASRLSEVVYSQADHYVRLRDVERVPDDPQFAQQWHLRNEKTGADIRATLAWSFGTGGKDPDGNPIVAAIVDGGFDVFQSELRANVWTHWGEIPNNKVDDDGNGYVDDENGWNAIQNNAKIPANYHGTHVAGITGAEGGNGRSVVGINWDVRLMPVAAASGKTSVVAAGYGYVLAQKKLWLSSGGKKGANVVVTNSSFGVDRANCESGDFPVWNDLYNEMGKAGILSAAATANANVDVDSVGDVPTGCSSAYLITVTNTTREDVKNAGAGYGTTTIDLGAPGTDILSTLPGSATGLMTGTSMATPMVTGSVAFLHSVAGPKFQEILHRSPGEASLELKRILLATVDPLPSLQGRTVSGGRLNLYKAAKAIRE